MLDAVIAYFTGGSSLVAQVSAKISRLTAKTSQLGSKAANFGKNLGQKANSLGDLWKFIKKELDEFLEAVKSGDLINWLKKKFFEFSNDAEGLRKLYLNKWLKKFDKNFANHLSGDAALEKAAIFFKQDYYLVPKGQGGHWLNKFLKVDQITFPPGVSEVAQLVDDVPFKAKVTIKSLKGNSFPKTAESSMFPKNWDVKRIQEEVAFVYENAQKNPTSIKQIATNSTFGKIEGESTQGFKILIEVDFKGNIMNAYPKL